MMENQFPPTRSHVEPSAVERADAFPAAGRTERRHESSSAVAAYDRARRAIADALTISDVQQVRLGIEQMKAYARLAKDRDLMADVMALQQRSERRLGEMLAIAKERGQLSRGGRPRKDGGAETTAAAEGVWSSDGSGSDQPLDSLTLKQAGIDWKLSARAQKLAAIPAQAFEDVVERAREKIRAGGAVVVNPVKDHTTKEKALLRAVREAQLAARQKALPERKYGVILADPEWLFATYSAAGKDRAADNHYPTSALEVIAARPVGTIAADDCICALWVTMPHLAIGSHVAVLAGWGFVPKTVFIWDKVVAGTGYWGRNRVEALVIGVRGNVPAPAPGTQWEDLVVEAKTGHSEKPDWAYEWLEQHFPNLSKIELNARSRREGWDAWGFEAPDEVEQAATPSPGPSPQGGGRQEDGQPSLMADVSAAMKRAYPDEYDALRVAAGLPPAIAADGAGLSRESSAPLTSQPLTTEQQNDILRAGYAREPKASIVELMAATGLKKSTVKMRLIRLGLSDPANQKAAARALMRKINAERIGA